MNLFTAIIAGAVGLAVTWAAIPLILNWAPRLASLHRPPDLHHTHKAPIPRFGGLALAFAFLGVEFIIPFIWTPDGGLFTDRGVVVLGSLAMFVLGFWDDIRPLGAKRKLFGQVVISFLVWFGGIGIERFRLPVSGTEIDLGVWAALFTLVWLVGMTNLINLIDGVDGLAGGICLMLMALTAYVGQQSGDLALLAAGMAGALLGFLRFNFPPARIYLGDGGAYFLGFQIGVYSLVNSQKGTILAALAAPLFVLALPIVDTGLAILRRGLRGLPIFRADRHHIHHHMLGMGMSRRRVVLSIYSVTAVFMLLGLMAFWSKGKLVPVLLGAVVLILLALAGRLSFSREWFAVGRVVGNSLEMRQEIHYALALARWLELDGPRCESVEELWGDLVLAARKLGFHSLKLTVKDETRGWKSQLNCSAASALTYKVNTGTAGILELEAQPGEPQRNNEERFGWVTAAVGPDLFEILSELLAEGWMKAVRSWTARTTQPLSLAGLPVAPPEAVEFGLPLLYPQTAQRMK